MNEERWIELYLGHSDYVMTLWTVYVLVLTLVVGFVARQPRLGAVRGLLVVAFLLFAIGNGVPLFRTQTTLVDIHARLPDETLEILRVSSPCHGALIHAVIDVIVLVFLVGWGNWFGPKNDGTAPVSGN